jgi:hypothetical protein
VKRTCPACNGTKRIAAGDHLPQVERMSVICPTCDGAGEMDNPKTLIAVFAYGNVWAQTLLCLIRDCTYAAWNTARSNLLAEMQQAHAKVEGVGEADEWSILLHTPHQDALIDRARSICIKNFLDKEECKDFDVLVMLDHDMEWVGANGSDYPGDILHVTRRAHDSQNICGAVISKKAKHQGVACLWKQPGVYNLGTDGFVPVHYVGAGMTAYPRKALQAVVDAGVDWEIDGEIRNIKEIPPGFTPSCLPTIVVHPYAGQGDIPEDEYLHLSEDWALCHRAEKVGYQSEIALRPLVTHFGQKGFTVVGDSQPEEPSPPPVEGGDYPAVAKASDNDPVKISLIHATRGRPEKALAAREMWYQRMTGDYNVEYIFSTDTDDESATSLALKLDAQGLGDLKFIEGDNRGNVDAYNRGAAQATGNILVQVHDDVEPPQDWDKLIVDKIGDVSRPVVLNVDDSNPVNADQPPLVTIGIMTRAFAKKMGGLYWHEYVSIYCDADLAAKAEKDGCLVQSREIKFKHVWGGAEGDETYKKSYAPANWEQGAKVLAERKAAGFPDAGA